MNLLREYRRKRPPGQSPEPRGGRPTTNRNSFLVQRHDATRLHYDLRLEVNGVLKSWAVPKGPSLNPAVKRLAIQTEDHPLDYGNFEGTIPEGNYGAGEVLLWDRGTYSPVGNLSASAQLGKGELKFVLHGSKLKGGFVLVKLRNATAKKEWLLIKHRDPASREDWSIEEHDRSVKSQKLPRPSPRAYRAKSSAVVHRSGVQNLRNAVKSPFPESLRPALASPCEKAFSDKNWLFEIKWDGIRALAVIQDGKTELVSRSGRIMSAEYPEFQDLAKYVRARQAVLDGEIVVLDSKGRSNFQRLQSRFGVEHPSRTLQQEASATFYLFDVLYCDGYDVRRAPLLERKQLLARLLIDSGHARISQHHLENGIELFEAAVKNGLEGLIAKRIDSPYYAGKTTSWLKFKAVPELDAVIGGWTNPRGSRRYFGSLLLGLYEKSSLRFIGGVGTGFSRTLEKDVFEKLEAISSDKCPFTPTPQTREGAHWVSPKLVARVGYAQWTSDRHLRQPRFLGLQPDRRARESTVGKEHIAAIVTKLPSGTESRSRSPMKKTRRRSRQFASALEPLAKKEEEQISLELNGHSLILTHLRKIYFPESGYTKGDILSYYAAVSSHLLPFLKDRPLVLHRYPNGIAGTAFYQKEAGPAIPDWIGTVDIDSETKGRKITYFLINDLASLLYLTNLGCIEHNPFSARSDDLEKPDYMFLDLDPTGGAAFSRVVRAANAVGEVLRRARLQFFVKTSGATGLHIFIPIVRKYPFEQVRAFLEIVTRIAMDREKGLLTRTHRIQDRPSNSVFVDVRQNAFAQSLASVFSLRPREGAPVSTPLSWSELKSDLKPDRWNLPSVLKDLPRRAGLWAKFWDHPQTLEKAVAALGRVQSR